MFVILFKLLATEFIVLIFGCMISHAIWDFKIPLMPRWWKYAFGMTVVVLMIAIFVTALLAVWTL
jgi:hypothetical protein